MVEHHGPVGWHYHYCDTDGRRSDTILSWDSHHAQQKKIRPLFWDRHVEKNSKFQARAALWADKKRQSIYKACHGDLKRAITEFRHLSDEASAVWPAGARPTQNPIQATAAIDEALDAVQASQQVAIPVSPKHLGNLGVIDCWA